jgi:hypothetical protein
MMTAGLELQEVEEIIWGGGQVTEWGMMMLVMVVVERNEGLRFALRLTHQQLTDGQRSTAEVHMFHFLLSF